MRRDDDLRKVPQSGYHGLSDGELLRLVQIGRNSSDPGDKARGLSSLVALIGRYYERTRQFVVVWRYQTPGGAILRIDAQDVDDVAMDAYLRAVQVKFRGVSVGELVNLLRTVVHRTCLDWHRRLMARDKGRGRSLDEPVPTGEGDELVPQVEHPEARGELERVLGQPALVDLAGELLRALPDERKRRVLELTFFERLTSKEISERLGESVANVDQLRSRGLRALRQIARERGIEPPWEEFEP